MSEDGLAVTRALADDEETCSAYAMRGPAGLPEALQQERRELIEPSLASSTRMLLAKQRESRALMTQEDLEAFRPLVSEADWPLFLKGDESDPRMCGAAIRTAEALLAWEDEAAAERILANRVWTAAKL